MTIKIPAPPIDKVRKQIQYYASLVDEEITKAVIAGLKGGGVFKRTFVSTPITFKFNGEIIYEGEVWNWESYNQ